MFGLPKAPGLPGVPGLSIQDFKAVILGFTRPNRFALVLQPPGAFNFDSAVFSSSALFAIKSAVIPQKTISEIDVKHLGMTRKIASSPTFEPITLTFRCDSAWTVRAAIENWMDTISKMDKEGKLSSGYNAEYADGSMKIIQLDTDNLPVAVYDCHEIFPTNVGEITLDQDTPDSIGEFTVIFSIGWWNRNEFVGGLNFAKQIKNKVSSFFK